MSELSAQAQLKILALVWGEGETADGWVFLPWIPGGGNDAKSRRMSWHEGPAFKWPGERAKILEHLEDHEDDDLYFTPNVFTGETRSAHLAAEETRLYADLDEVDPRTDIRRNLRPTIAWETSPGRFQGVWLLSGMVTGASERGGLNHRLSSYLNADNSGWDSTQLLRVPGRPNHKPGYRDDNGYPAPARLLWVLKGEDGPLKYSEAYLESLVPDVEFAQLEADIEDAEIEEIDYRRVWQRVRLKCSKAVRELMSMRAADISEEHDRSEKLWQIERDLANAGCTIAEMVAIVRHSPWNKFAGRSNELNQLKGEAIKAKAEGPGDAPLEDESAQLPSELDWLSSLARQTIPRPAWLVNNIWAKESVGFIAAEPKSYKSYTMLDMALSIATGTPFLNDPQFATGEPERVLYVQEEDSLGPIMQRAAQILEGKAPDRFWRGQMMLRGSLPHDDPERAAGALSDALFVPPGDDVPIAMQVRKGLVLSDPAWLAWLDEMLEEYGFKFVVIDTLGTTIGGIDINESGTLNTRVLRPLKQLSDKHHTAIAIVHHNRKPSSSSGGRAGQQMLGSTAIHAWVESGLYLQKDEYVTGQPALVRIERENKMAQELKFRVKIPTMYEEGGESTQGDRQLWEPIVLPGWGEEQGDEEVEKDNQQRAKQGNKGAAGDTRGRKLALFVKRSMSSGPHSFEHLVERYGQPNGQVKTQLDGALDNEFMAGDDESGYTSLI